MADDDHVRLDERKSHAYNSCCTMRRETHMSKIAKNLYLDPQALKHAEAYGRLHRTNLSQLVSDFLHSLPLEASSQTELSPAVQRLIGSAVPRNSDTPDVGVEDYRRYLTDKYGRAE